MIAPELFDDEQKVIAKAEVALNDASLSTESCRSVLRGLLHQYVKLVRISHRLIKKSDRWEREINVLNKKLHVLQAELQFKADHDSLTGILNRGAVFQKATRYLEKTALTIVLIDIDFFKKINDEHGHPRGDAVLKEFVVRLSNLLGSTGAIGRIGGEEFTVLLPETSLQDGLGIATDMCTAISHQPFESMDGSHVTASFGVSWGACGSRIDSLYMDADNALYVAKHNGRNRVELSSLASSVYAEQCVNSPIRARARHAQEIRQDSVTIAIDPPAFSTDIFQPSE